MNSVLATLLALVPAAPMPTVDVELPTDAEPATSTLLDMIRAGGPMMYPLAALSVLTLALMVVFFLSVRRGAMVSRRYMTTADALIRKKDYLGLLAISNRHNEGVARVMQRTVEFLTKNPRASLAEIREIAQTEGQRQAAAMNQQVTWLADIGTVAPMLGLLGTVLGIIQSFGVVAMDAAATRPTMLAHGIGEALIATAAGLFVGIPAMAAYAYYRSRAQGAISDLETATTHLLALLGANGTSGRDVL
jgi:biopolymer transport protein ExbB